MLEDLSPIFCVVFRICPHRGTSFKNPAKTARSRPLGNYSPAAAAPLKRHDHFEGYVSSQGGNADVLQAAKVGHIGLVGEVRADNIQRQARFAPNDYVSPGGCADCEGPLSGGSASRNTLTIKGPAKEDDIRSAVEKAGYTFKGLR